MKGFLNIIVFFLIFKCQNASPIENTIENYIKIITAYFKQTRNVRVLTHISCFSQSKLNIFITYVFDLVKNEQNWDMNLNDKIGTISIKFQVKMRKFPSQ